MRAGQHGEPETESGVVAFRVTVRRRAGLGESALQLDTGAQQQEVALELGQAEDLAECVQR
jgi:hypothetical protein